MRYDDDLKVSIFGPSENKTTYFQAFSICIPRIRGGNLKLLRQLPFLCHMVSGTTHAIMILLKSLFDYNLRFLNRLFYLGRKIMSNIVCFIFDAVGVVAIGASMKIVSEIVYA